VCSICDPHCCSTHGNSEGILPNVACNDKVFKKLWRRAEHILHSTINSLLGGGQISTAHAIVDECPPRVPLHKASLEGEDFIILFGIHIDATHFKASGHNVLQMNIEETSDKVECPGDASQLCLL
jgi:hypothetical protein